jgi:hypothetical protein
MTEIEKQVQLTKDLSGIHNETAENIKNTDFTVRDQFDSGL